MNKKSAILLSVLMMGTCGAMAKGNGNKRSPATVACDSAANGAGGSLNPEKIDNAIAVCEKAFAETSSLNGLYTVVSDQCNVLYEKEKYGTENSNCRLLFAKAIASMQVTPELSGKQ